MAVKKIALVSDVKGLRVSELERTAAALQTQLDRDFEPIWKIQAKIQPYSSLRKVPHETWPVTIRKEVGAGVFSYHDISNGIPYAMVMYGDEWQLGASHDMLEMLADPSCNRMISGPSIKPGERERVQFLVQVCDPCSSPEFAYQIDGVTVSDFCTPDFFSRGKAKARYSFTGAVKKPLDVLKRGYLSWLNPRTRHWWQKNWWGDEPEYRDLGPATAENTTPLDESPSREKNPATRKRTRRAPVLAVSFREEILLVQRAEITKARADDENIEDLIARYGTTN